MKIKTSELQDPALDWAVAKCLNLDPQVYGGSSVVWIGTKRTFSPSRSWSEAGPIIERECISLKYSVSGPRTVEVDAEIWPDYSVPCKGRGTGPTALIAAMRALVAYKLGGEVEIPEELL